MFYDRQFFSTDLHEAEELMSIVLYSSKLHVRTFAFAIKSFKTQVSCNQNN